MADNFPAISTSTFFGKKNCGLKTIVPANPVLSDLSDSESEDENEPLANIAAKNPDQKEVPASHDVIQEESSDTDSDQEYIEPEYQEVPKKKRKQTQITFSWTKTDIPSTPLLNPTLEDSEDVLTPLEYFLKFMSYDVMNQIVDQTNIYSVQKDGKCIGTSPSEITDFISILLKMSIIKLPSIEDYWSSSSRIPHIADIMSSKRFRKLRTFVHCNDNSKITAETKDRYYKVRPVLEMVRKNCQENQFENQYSVDETMIAYKGTYAGNLRQFIQNKPHKWGYKFFVRAGVSGYIADFIPYQGCTTFDTLCQTRNELTEEEKSFGVGGGVVIALCKTIENPEVSTIFCDNWFSSLNLFCYLKQKFGILSLGTIRSNRIAGCILETDKVLQNRGKGSYTYRTDVEKGIILVKWADSKCVLLASTLCGIQPTNNVKRYSKEQKKKINVPCPALILQYNKHMGGVDKANSLLGLYRSPSRAKRWYFPIFTWIIDICVINAWILYKNDCGINKQKPLALKQFKLQVAASLSHTGKEKKQNRLFLMNTENKIQHPIAPRPDVATRKDMICHWPQYTSKGRCRNCKTGFTRMMCNKCDMRLCLTEKKNCFYFYHND